MPKCTQPFIVIAFMLFAIIGSLSVKAQPPSKTEQQKTYDYGKKLRDDAAENKRMRDAADRSAKANQSGPNKPPSGSGTKYKFEIARDKQAQKEQDAIDLKERAAAAELKKKLDAEASERAQAQHNREWAAAKEKRETREAIMKKRDDFMAKSVTDYKGPLSPIDNADLSRDIVYAWHNDLTRDKEQTINIETFEREKNTGKFDRLLTVANSTARHADYATNAYNHLLTRFPEHREEIEKATLDAMSYYFGGRRPDVYRKDPKFYPDDTLFYPASIYEEATLEEKNILLQRFKTLAAKYPDVALKAAGSCRSQLNPFQLLAELSEADEQQCAALHMKVLHTDYSGVTAANGAIYKPDYKDRDVWEKLADRRLRKSALYLMKYSRKELRSLTKENWQEIAKLQGLNIDHVQHAFQSPTRFDKDEKNFSTWTRIWKVLPALWAAYDEEFQAWFITTPNGKKKIENK